MPVKNMPLRYCWTAILALACCAPLFDRKSDLERGMISYERGDYAGAARYFDAYYAGNPAADSVLYYLFSCYQHLDRIDDQIVVLERLAARNARDENIYLNLVHLYRTRDRHGALFDMLARLEPSIGSRVDRHLILTRRLYAELLCGAAAAGRPADPLAFCVSRGYLPVAPDGQAFESDTVTMAQLIVLLDRLVAPVPPRDLYAAPNIPARSYLYLPYMRLVDLGILEFDAHVTPEHNASVLTAAHALARLKKRGIFG